jgi:hypothetical protein
MNDVGDAWTTLEPTPQQRRRIDSQVFAWLDARDTPLAVEWVRLFKAEPFAAVGLLATSAISLAAATPVLWLALARL